MKERIDLWDSVEQIPGYTGASDGFRPYMDLYLLEDAPQPAPCVVVLPGGGYCFVSVENEGSSICEMLNAAGYSAVMVNYRVAPYTYPCMVLDAQRAIRTVRYRAAQWNVDPDKIGTIGFSAGGHLCCMTGLLFDDGKPDGDEIDAVSCRPNTVAPCYAVTTFDGIATHGGTRQNFFGRVPTEEEAAAFSSENMIRPDAPPFFLWHTATDDCVSVECSLRLASALAKHGVPCETHIFPYGGHGLGVAKSVDLACRWTRLYVEWLDHYNR